MNAETLKALRKSIEHWEANSMAETPDGVSTGSDACALCGLFFKNSCAFCPVAVATGCEVCEETPYDMAAYYSEHWKVLNTPENKLAFQRAAREEVNFLRALVPAEEVK